MASLAKCKHCSKEYGTARYISIDAVRDRMVCDDCKAQRETAAEPSAVGALIARIDRAIAHAKSLKSRHAPAPTAPVTTDAERAAELLRYF
jgi:hypothetical protein